MKSKQADEPQERRGFIGKITGGLVAILALFPFASGLPALLDPIRRKSGSAKWMSIAPFKSLPDDGLPSRFPVIANRQDAWTTYPKKKIGYVFVAKEISGKTKAYSASCPHVGCLVDFDKSTEGFRCPCHNASFAKNGVRTGPENPSPRDLDPLETKVEKGEVWVHFRKYRLGTKEREGIS